MGHESIKQQLKTSSNYLLNNHSIQLNLAPQAHIK